MCSQECTRLTISMWCPLYTSSPYATSHSDTQCLLLVFTKLGDGIGQLTNLICKIFEYTFVFVRSCATMATGTLQLLTGSVASNSPCASTVTGRCCFGCPDPNIVTSKATLSPGLKPYPQMRSRDCVRSSSVEQMLIRDRKSTRLNSSHLVISYAVFCL